MHRALLSAVIRQGLGPGPIKPFCQEGPEPFHLEFLLPITHYLAGHLAPALPFLN